MHSSTYSLHLGIDTFILCLVLDKFSNHRLLCSLKRRDDLKEAYNYFKNHTATIEIQKDDGKMERVYFEVPDVCKYLTSESKTDLLWSVDRESQNTKISDFIGNILDVKYMFILL